MTLVRTSLLGAALGIAAFLASSVGWNALQSSTAAPVAPAAADQTLGTAMMYARVNANGSLGTLSGGVVSVQKLGFGDYSVTFDRPISTCGRVASMATQSGLVMVYFDANLPDNTFHVKTMDVAGTSSDRPFNLVVICTR